MIKFLRSLRQYKTLIIVILFAPLLPLIFMSDIHFDYVPENPFQEFNVTMTVPQRNAREISLRVAQVAERNFNGIAGLISLKSISRDESAQVTLRFNKGISESSAYLLIQEKLDRIKLELPTAVEKIEVKKNNHLEDQPNHIEVKFKSNVSSRRLQELLMPYNTQIEQIEPNIFNNNKINLKVRFADMQRLQIPMSQLMMALKASGLKAAIGQQQEVFFGVGQSLQSIDDIKGIIISSVGHRPILVSDVADIQIETVEMPEQILQIKLNDNSAEQPILSIFENQFTQDIESLKTPMRNQFLNAITKYIALFVVIILMQFFLQKYFFGIESKFFATLLFNILINCHYIFWKSRFSSINIFDLDVLSVTEAVGNILWFILLTRIRYYFLPQHRIPKIPRSLEQSTLMTMGELFPTYLLFYGVIILLSLPLTLNVVNLPSAYILVNFLKYGMPINLLLIMVLPIVEGAKWIRSAKLNHAFTQSWNLSPRFMQNSFYVSIAIIVLLPLAFFDLPWAVNQSSKKDIANNYRGYTSYLEYLVQSTEETPRALSGHQHKIYNNYVFSPLGLKLLPQLDLQSFVYSVKDVQSQTKWGYFETPQGILPITISADFAQADMQDFYLASKTSQPVKLRYLINQVSQVEQSEIYREKMDSYVLVKGSESNLKENSDHLKRNLWSDFLAQEFNNYYFDHLVYFVFIYLLLAIYLNSFIRSLLMLAFLQLIMGFIVCFRWFIPVPFHVDSLWLLPLTSALVFLILLVQTRIVDMERTRGIDRDEAIEDLRAQLIMPFSYVLTPLIVTLFLKSYISSSGFWKEGAFIFISLGMCLFLLNRYLFPILYLQAEEFIEKKIYNYYLLWKKLKKTT